MSFSGGSVKPEEAVAQSSDDLSWRFVPDRSDVNVITEAQTEKGSLALKAHWPHNSPIRCVSNDMETCH